MSLANNFRLSIFVKAHLSIDLKIIFKTKSLWDRSVLAGRATLHTVRLRFYLQILRFAHQVFWRRCWGFDVLNYFQIFVLRAL